MDRSVPFEEMREKVRDIYDLTQQLYNDSGDFPAVNRNAKRILASFEMLKINLEEA